MKKISLLFSFLIIAISTYAYIASFRNGQEIEADEIGFSEGLFQFDTQTSPRNSVKSITFDEKTASTGEVSHSDMVGNKSEYIKIADKYARKYPDASGIIIRDIGTYTLRTDGSRVYSYHFVGKILTPEALNWGQRPLYFEDGRSRVRMIFERTIMPDKSEVWWDTTDYTITEPSEEGVFFDYGKIYSPKFPGVKVGSIVEYVYESETYNPFDPNFFSPGFYFQDENPVVKSQAIVIIPIDKELNYKNYKWPKGNKSPEIAVRDSIRIYNWLIEDSPPFVTEPDAPSYADLVPRFSASLFHDWNYIYDWLGHLQRERMEVTQDIRDQVTEICDGATDMADSINRIYIWVQREIHYISIKGSISSGQTGHSAQFTFEKKYGDCSDKSILLATMLKEIGVEAYPIVLKTNDEEEETRKIPDLSGNHAITMLILNGERIFLDPTSTSHTYPYFRSDDAGVTYVCPLKREWGMISTPPPEDNAQHISIQSRLTVDGNLEGTFRADYVGDWEASYRGFWESQPQEQRQFIMQDWMSYIISGAQITDWSLPGADDIFTPFSEIASFNIDNFPDKSGDIWLLKIPAIENAYSFDELALEERQFPIEYTAPKQVTHKIVIDLPSGFEIEYIPEKIALENEYSSYYGEYSIQGKTIIFEDNYRLKKRIVEAKDYKKYKEFCHRIEDYIDQRVFVSER